MLGMFLTALIGLVAVLLLVILCFLLAWLIDVADTRWGTKGMVVLMLVVFALASSRLYLLGLTVRAWLAALLAV